jgi:hypothetical protein
MHEVHASPLRRFFSGLTEYTFQTRLGVADPPLIDYLSDLLTRFVRSDVIYRVRDSRGKLLVQVADMLNEAEQRIGSARRDVHRHIGDFTLFWAGLYPESLSRKQSASDMDQLLDYWAQGKRAYWIASRIEVDDSSTELSDILERLSYQFEMCAYGLREVRSEWERRDDGPQAPTFLIN